MANRMDKWLHHTFSSGCETGSDYDAFQRETGKGGGVCAAQIPPRTL